MLTRGGGVAGDARHHVRQVVNVAQAAAAGWVGGWVAPGIRQAGGRTSGLWGADGTGRQHVCQVSHVAVGVKRGRGRQRKHGRVEFLLRPATGPGGRGRIRRFWCAQPASRRFSQHRTQSEQPPPFMLTPRPPGQLDAGAGDGHGAVAAGRTVVRQGRSVDGRWQARHTAARGQRAANSISAAATAATAGGGGGGSSSGSSGGGGGGGVHALPATHRRMRSMNLRAVQERGRAGKVRMARPKGGATVQTEGERAVGSIPTGMKLMEKKVWARLPSGGVRRVRALAGDPAPGSRLRPAASLKAPLPFPPLPFPSLPSPSLPFPSLPFPSPPLPPSGRSSSHALPSAPPTTARSPWRCGGRSCRIGRVACVGEWEAGWDRQGGIVGTAFAAHPL